MSPSGQSHDRLMLGSIGLRRFVGVHAAHPHSVALEIDMGASAINRDVLIGSSGLFYNSLMQIPITPCYHSWVSSKSKSTECLELDSDRHVFEKVK